MDNIDSRISIKIKTNIFKNDFILEIPIKNIDKDNIFKELKKDNGYLKITLNKSLEKIVQLEQKINNLEKIINTKIKDSSEIILFEKSTIIKNDYERKLLESFIKENDNTIKYIYPNLLFKATIDGDTPKDFHKKCDYMGSTLVIIQSDTGRRFGGYSSISWDQTRNGWCNEGVVFLFSLDTRKYYKNTQGSYYVNHSPHHGPEFGAGHDLTISSGCLNNSNSYSLKSSFKITSYYELNGGIERFKAIDYEVFQI